MVLMVKFGVIINATVAIASAARGLIVVELVPGYLATQPVESHIHGLDFPGCYCVVCDANYGGVVGLYGRPGLRPFHFDKCLSQWYHFLSSNEKYKYFGFSCIGHDKLDDISYGYNSSIELGVAVLFRQEDMCSYMATGAREVQIKSFRMSGEYHVTVLVFDAIFGVDGGVVKDLVDVCIGGFGCGSLFITNGSDINKGFVVDG